MVSNIDSAGQDVWYAVRYTGGGHGERGYKDGSNKMCIYMQIMETYSYISG